LIIKEYFKNLNILFFFFRILTNIILVIKFQQIIIELNLVKFF